MTRSQKEPSYLYDVSPIFAALIFLAWLGIALIDANTPEGWEDPETGFHRGEEPHAK